MQDSPSIPPPRSAIGMGPVPLTVPSSVGPSAHKSGHISRPRGFSAPGAFPPIIQGSAGWNNGYSRAALPPLTVPSYPPHLSHMSGYHHSPHPLNPLTPANDSPTSPAFNYSNNSQYPYSEQNHWSSQNATYSSHNGSLSSLLNPSNGGYSRPTPTINTSYGSPASSMSPDSRPTTGYSMSSVSSLPYQEDYSRPSSSHHRPISPSRPPSSKSSYSTSNNSQTSLGIVRRARRHSQAMSPYPSPYEQSPEQQRPSTSPQPIDEHHSGGLPRVRSMIQLPSVDPYSFSPGQADFAYSAVPGAVGSTASIDSMNDGWASARSGRPSTAASSISAASHTSSSQANTPPVQDGFHGEGDINRCDTLPPHAHHGYTKSEMQ
ncbi:hypothetical protein B0H14DRAFT_2662409 [Mycena olivaceomarginata]|nr:hypothetical protein B0H14DRAFT_2662409 [Mycena olivaceomarginata]